MKGRLTNYFKAGFPGVAINTYEESRAIDDVLAAAKDCGKSVLTWSATEGTKMIRPQVKDYPDTADLYPACTVREKDSVYILRDIAGWPFDRDPLLTRAFRDLLSASPMMGSCIVTINPAFTPQPSFEKLLVVTDYTLPGEDDLRKVAEAIAESGGVKFNGEAEVVRALSGLSTAEAENACALSIIETGELDEKIIYREKVQGVRKSGLLEIIDPDPRGLDAVGGLDLFKIFLTECVETFRRYEEARQYPLLPLKGILALGPPGTGKSLMAKVIGTIFGIPTLRWDVATTRGKYVGDTERDTKRTLDMADALAPCILWVDELDKAFSGTKGGGEGDTGVGMRMFGQVITWMQERKTPVFLFATANEIKDLPSALYRKGRFDEIFALDLPTRIERAAIFDVHLKKRRRGGIADLNVLADATKDFVGAEIESAVEGAMRRAFSERREVTEKDILTAIGKTIPLARTAQREMDEMRAWARENRASPASSPEIETVATGRKMKR